METAKQFSDFLTKIGTINFLAIGIAIVAIWIFISGLRKGLKKGRRPKDSENDDS